MKLRQAIKIVNRMYRWMREPLRYPLLRHKDGTHAKAFERVHNVDIKCRGEIKC